MVGEKGGETEANAETEERHRALFSLSLSLSFFLSFSFSVCLSVCLSVSLSDLVNWKSIIVCVCIPLSLSLSCVYLCT